MAKEKVRFLSVLMGLAGLVHNAQAEMPESLAVTAVQMEISGDISANLARITQGIHDAANQGARVVLFPETALSGFNESDIDALDWDVLEGAMSAVARMARDHTIYVLYGTATRSDKARPYNSAVLVGPDGTEITRYHKLGPEPWFEPGDHLALFDIDGVLCTVMICHDERFPEVTRLPVLAGARVSFYISYEINRLPDALRKAEGYRAQLIARAAENGIWVCQANGIGPLGGSERLSLGHSRIVDPGGTVVVEAPAMVDTTIAFTLRPHAARRGNALESLELKPVQEWWREGMKLIR